MGTARLPLLDHAVQDAARRIARVQLAAAGRALVRARNTGDLKALHAFRVAIRRLRSLLSNYRHWLGRAAGKKPRRRLRELTRATNAARDADVVLEWLALQSPYVGKQDQAGLAWMRRSVQRRRQVARRLLRPQLARESERAISLLRGRLSRLDTDEAAPFRSAFLEVLGPAADELRERLAAISGPGDWKNIHRARVSSKRLRYLIEPLRTANEETGAIVKRLRKLQKLSGELHDMHLIEAELSSAVEESAREKARRLHGLAVRGEVRRLSRARGRDESLGLLTLAALARARRDALYEKLERKWLADAGRSLDRGLHDMRESLVAPAGQLSTAFMPPRVITVG
jgi:CHAD domain-containing protein